MYILKHISYFYNKIQKNQIMKKFLLSLLTVFAVFTMSASETTFDLTTGYTNTEVVTNVGPKDGMTLTCAKGENTSNDPKWYTTGTGVRTYAKNTLTISSTAGNITSVSFVFSGTYNWDAFKNGTVATPSTVDTGTLTTDSWTGSAS